MFLRPMFKFKRGIDTGSSVNEIVFTPHWRNPTMVCESCRVLGETRDSRGLEPVVMIQLGSETFRRYVSPPYGSPLLHPLQINKKKMFKIPCFYNVSSYK